MDDRVHPRIYGQHKLNSIGYFLKNRTDEVRGGGRVEGGRMGGEGTGGGAGDICSTCIVCT